MSAPTPMTSSHGPLVTIAIPTFNRANGFFPKSLASACAQTYTRLEILVADNASEDDTQNVVEALKDPRIRYYRHLSNIGPSRNMNFCIQQARGDYLVILPDDDLVDPDFVESCAALALDNPQAGLIRTGTRVIDAAGRVLVELPNEAVGLSFDQLVVAWIDGKTSPYQCSIMFRTAPIQGLGMHSRHYLFDDACTFFTIAGRHGCADVRGLKARFRLHEGELTSQAPMRDWCEDSIDLLNLLCDLSPANAEFVRTNGLRFLATGNYRRALRRPFPRSLLDCLTVFRTHKFMLPPRRYLARAARRRLSGMLRPRMAPAEGDSSVDKTIW
jgi:glycosyltransferase involved in cell wall biosynthesis